MAYKVQWQDAQGNQYETDYTVSGKKKAQEIADRVLDRMNTFGGYNAGQGAWIVRV